MDQLKVPRKVFLSQIMVLYCPFLKSIAGKKNKMQDFTHELVYDLGKEIKEMIITRELLDKLGQIWK